MTIQVNHDVLYYVFRWLEPNDVEACVKAFKVKAVRDAAQQYYLVIEQRLLVNAHITVWKNRLLSKCKKNKPTIDIDSARIRVHRLAFGVIFSVEERTLEGTLKLFCSGKESEFIDLNRAIGGGKTPLPPSQEYKRAASQETFPLSEEQ